MARPSHPARRVAADLAGAGASPGAIQTAIRETYSVSRSTLSRIMAETATQITTLEASVSRLKRIAIRAEQEGNHTAAIAAHRAIKETLRELRLARSYAELEAGEDALMF